MSNTTGESWIAGIEAEAELVSSYYGCAVAEHVFHRYGACDAGSLNPAYYSEVLAEPAQIAND